MSIKNLGRVQGLSAYEIWLQQGNTGTEEDFIASLIGVNGRGIASIEKTSTDNLIDIYTITYTDNTTDTFQVKNGKDGTNGQDGKDGANGQDGVNGRGIASIEKTSTSGLVDTYTITYTDDTTSTYNVTNGKDAQSGGELSITLNGETKNQVDGNIDLGNLVDENTYNNDMTKIYDAIGNSSSTEQNLKGLSTLQINNLDETSLNINLNGDNLVLLPYDNNFSNSAPLTDDIVTKNGLSFKANKDGSIAIWGTATAQTIYNMRNYYASANNTSRMKLNPGTYTVGVDVPNILEKGIATGSIRISTSLYSSAPIYMGNPATFVLDENTTNNRYTFNLLITTAFKDITEDDPVIVYPILNEGTELKFYTCPKTKGLDINSDSTFPDVNLTVVKNDVISSQVTIANGMETIDTTGITKLKLITDLPVYINTKVKLTTKTTGSLEKSLNIVATSSTATSPTSVSKATFTNGETLNLEETFAKKNKQLVFFATIETMGTLKLYHGENLYNSGWIEIDDTNLKVYTYDSTSHERKNVAHGLTIKDYIGVITKTGNNNDLEVKIITNGGTYSASSIYWSASNGMIKAVSDGCSFKNVRMSWNTDDFKKKIWMYGDSYFDFQNKARWPYHMVNWGFDNCGAFGFPGAKSSDVYPEWQRTLNHGTPKYAVWCLGMNDADSSTSINASWQTYANKFIEDCLEKGIEPILATIPNTPNRQHTYKNEFIKNSGYRYIDFAEAVNATEYPATWYEGMISDDNTHPYELGAICLAMRAISDVPELIQE